MGYFKDVWGIVVLNDDAYKKVGNDKRALKKYFLALVLSFYILALLAGVFFSVLSILSPLGELLSAGNIAIILPLLIIAPLVAAGMYFVVSFIVTLIPHAIGLLFGGRPHTYRDFFKITNYVAPFVLPLMLFVGKVAEGVYLVWYFFMLYRAYKNIHKLNPTKAGWAVVVNIVISLIFIVVIAAFFVFMLAAAHQGLAKIVGL